MATFHPAYRPSRLQPDTGPRWALLTALTVAVAACGGADAADPNGLEREDSEARGDRTAPTLQITSPVKGTSYSASAPQLSLAGVAGDNRQVARVTWTNDKGGAGVAAQSDNGTSVTWNAPAITLAEGNNSIVVRAYDRAGNVSSRSMAVSYAAAAGTQAPPPPSSPDPAPAPAPSAPAPAPAPAPTNGTGPWIDSAKMPTGSATVYTGERVKASAQTVSPTDVGSFRINCPFSHMSYDDPIVYPGQPGKAHLHTFFGNSAVNASTTAGNITASGSSTCHGGTVNRSGYWVASIIDTTDGTPIAPYDSLFYYKLGYRGVAASKVQPFPAGLRMIAGDAQSAVAANQYNFPYRWSCRDDAGTGTNYGFSIPNCDSAKHVALEVWFPQCWDGKNLDSPDHKSHMAYAQGGCPASHPVALPEISLNIHWKAPAGRTSAKWRLSSDAYDAALPAGYSAHADWFNGWKADVATTFVNNCIKNSMDCHANLLGDGRELY